MIVVFKCLPVIRYLRVRYYFLPHPVTLLCMEYAFYCWESEGLVPQAFRCESMPSPLNLTYNPSYDCPWSARMRNSFTYVDLSTCRRVDLPTCRSINLSTSRPVDLLTCRPVNMSSCRHVNLSTCRPVNMSICRHQHVDVSICRRVDLNLSTCHL